MCVWSGDLEINSLYLTAEPSDPCSHRTTIESAQVCTRKHAHTHTCTYIPKPCTHTYTHAHTYTHTHTYTHMHTHPSHAHTYTHTHIHTCTLTLRMQGVAPPTLNLNPDTEPPCGAGIDVIGPRCKVASVYGGCVWVSVL